MTSITIESLPTELISKVINPFSSNVLVCKLWFEIAEDLINIMFKNHKKRFAATLAEINSITYQYVDRGEFPSTIFNYRLSKEKYLQEQRSSENSSEDDYTDDYIEDEEERTGGSYYACDVYDSDGYVGEFYNITVDSRMRKEISVRQYKNKAAKYIYTIEQPTKYPVKSGLTRSNNWIDKYIMEVRTYYYVDADIIDDNFETDANPKYAKDLKIIPEGPYYQHNLDYEISEDESETDWDVVVLQNGYYLVYRYSTDVLRYEIYYCPIVSKLINPRHFK